MAKASAGKRERTRFEADLGDMDVESTLLEEGGNDLTAHGKETEQSASPHGEMRAADSLQAVVTVERIELGAEQEHRVALGQGRIGPVVIRGIMVWRSNGGRLRVYMPSYKAYGGRSGYRDAIELPPDLQSEVDAAVIAAYKDLMKGDKK
jgi:hypothetical protein